MKRNRMLASSLAAVLSLSLLAGCGGTGSSTTPAPGANATTPAQQSDAPKSSPVELTVVSTFAGEDTNAPNFEQALTDWAAQTGNKVINNSESSNETFKAKIRTDFQTGAEPDVLFFFNGVDANSFVEAGKVVSIDEIRKQYPEYATNMKDGMMGASPVDGVNYSVPVNGYWEGMFVNKAVIEAAGVSIPDANTTWDEFLDICQKIKDAGYTPIAASMAEIPHYWFEFTIYNHLGPNGHNILPAYGADFDENNAQYKGWVSGMEDLKQLYDLGYFPENTLSATDNETYGLFTSDQAAFLVDGSWKVGGIEIACGKDADNNVPYDPEMLANYTVTYVPGKDQRKTTDIIGGLSSGYYITKKAWDDPAKRDAAVSFVEYMTSDEMVGKFAETSGNLTTALKNEPPVNKENLSPLALEGLAMVQGATGIAGAVQDQIPQDCRTPMFVPGAAEIVSGQVTPVDAVKACLDLLAAQ